MNDAEALAVAYVDPMSLGVLEASATMAARSRSARGSRPATCSYGGPHYGFVAVREEFTPDARPIVGV